MDNALPKGLVIAAPSSGSGKTLVTLGLLRALADAGSGVASAKAGPDYIDPRFHEVATGRPCVNLDPWAMRPELITSLAADNGVDVELVIVEGVMGLFDGAETGEGSTADLAGLLGYPVILVVDALRQSHSAAALVRGFATHRPDCRIAGVIFNKVATDRHEHILRAALEPLEIPVLGCVRNVHDLEIPSRHLGLVQASEHAALETFIERTAQLVTDAVALDRLAKLADRAGGAAAHVSAIPPIGQRIAVAGDEAFGFSYPHLLQDWQRAGAQLQPFSPLADQAPSDDADAVYLPGGYPELHGGRLSQNETFLQGLRTHASRGSRIYGECGGFMVLGDELIDKDGRSHGMAGLLPVVTSFEERRLHLGYRHLTSDASSGLPRTLRGHEFHYSTLVSQGEGEPLFHARDAAGRDLGAMGLRRENVMGSYAHVIDMEPAT